MKAYTLLLLLLLTISCLRAMEQQQSIKNALLAYYCNAHLYKSCRKDSSKKRRLNDNSCTHNQRILSLIDVHLKDLVKRFFELAGRELPVQCIHTPFGMYIRSQGVGYRLEKKCLVPSTLNDLYPVEPLDYDKDNNQTEKPAYAQPNKDCSLGVQLFFDKDLIVYYDAYQNKIAEFENPFEYDAISYYDGPNKLGNAMWLRHETGGNCQLHMIHIDSNYLSGLTLYDCHIHAYAVCSSSDKAAFCIKNYNSVTPYVLVIGLKDKNNSDLRQNLQECSFIDPSSDIAQRNLHVWQGVAPTLFEACSFVTPYTGMAKARDGQMYTFACNADNTITFYKQIFKYQDGTPMVIDQYAINNTDSRKILFVDERKQVYATDINYCTATEKDTFRFCLKKIDDITLFLSNEHRKQRALHAISTPLNPNDEQNLIKKIAERAHISRFWYSSDRYGYLIGRKKFRDIISEKVDNVDQHSNDPALLGSINGPSGVNSTYFYTRFNQQTYRLKVRKEYRYRELFGGNDLFIHTLDIVKND